MQHMCYVMLIRRSDRGHASDAKGLEDMPEQKLWGL